MFETAKKARSTFITQKQHNNSSCLYQIYDVTGASRQKPDFLFEAIFHQTALCHFICIFLNISCFFHLSGDVFLHLGFYVVLSPHLSSNTCSCESVISPSCNQGIWNIRRCSRFPVPGWRVTCSHRPRRAVLSRIGRVKPVWSPCDANVPPQLDVTPGSCSAFVLSLSLGGEDKSLQDSSHFEVRSVTWLCVWGGASPGFYPTRCSHICYFSKILH